MRKKILLICILPILAGLLWLNMSKTKAAYAGKGLNNILSVLSIDSAFIDTYSHKLGISLDSSSNFQFISFVAGWLGTPYLRAGTSKNGTDCSGFVSSVYKEVFGISLIHSSAGMLYQMKERVKKSELREGDIIFFRINGKRISHVGIYLRDHKFIHASIYRGIVVDDLRDAYYQRAYYTAGRVICR